MQVEKIVALTLLIVETRWLIYEFCIVLLYGGYIMGLKLERNLFACLLVNIFNSLGYLMLSRSSITNTNLSTPWFQDELVDNV